jgi:hypothetical protein
MIDVEYGENWQGRLNGPRISDKDVNQIAASMKENNEFPTILLIKEGDRAFVGDGNHRFGATIKLGEITVPAFVVETKDTQLINLIIRGSNTNHGLSQNDDSIATNVMVLVKRGVSASEIAKWFSIPVVDVYNIKKESVIRKEFDDEGVNIDDIPRSSLLRISNVQSKMIRSLLVGIIIKNKLPCDKVMDLVTSLNKYKGDPHRQQSFLTDYQMNNPYLKARKTTKKAVVNSLATDGKKGTSSGSMLVVNHLTKAFEASRRYKHDITRQPDSALQTIVDALKDLNNALGEIDRVRLGQQIVQASSNGTPIFRLFPPFSEGSLFGNR